MARRVYLVRLYVNERFIDRVIIDSHYERKHARSVTDEIILKLVATLSGRETWPDDRKSPFFYFVSDLELDQKTYRLIWLLEDNETFLGVINAYRI